MTGYSKYRVVDLRQLCKDRGLPIKSRMKKDDLIEILTHGKTITKTPIKKDSSATLNINNLSIYPIDDLKQLCKDNGIDGYSNPRNIIIKKIQKFYKNKEISQLNLVNDDILLRVSNNTLIPQKLSSSDEIIDTITCKTKSKAFIYNRLMNITLDNLSNEISKVKYMYNDVKNVRDKKLIDKKIQNLYKNIGDLCKHN